MEFSFFYRFQKKGIITFWPFFGGGGLQTSASGKLPKNEIKQNISRYKRTEQFATPLPQIQIIILNRKLTSSTYLPFAPSSSYGAIRSGSAIVYGQ